MLIDLFNFLSFLNFFKHTHTHNHGQQDRMPLFTLIYSLFLLCNSIQALAAAYAYSVRYREYMEQKKGPLFEIAIALGKK